MWDFRAHCAVKITAIKEDSPRKMELSKWNRAGPCGLVAGGQVEGKRRCDRQGGWHGGWCEQRPFYSKKDVLARPKWSIMGWGDRGDEG